MKFVNNLGSAAETNVLAYKYGTDQTLHWADPLDNEANMWNHMAMPPAPGSEGAENYLGPIPACVHLHGGEVPPQLDGGPDAWFTSDGPYKGHGFYSRDGAAATNYNIYRYPNSQEGSLIWFHDHTLGATRLNVYCGLAGGYLVLDPVNDPKNLPEGPVPLDHPGSDVRHQRPALLPVSQRGRRPVGAQPRAPLLGAGVRWRRDLRQRQGVAVHERGTQALHVPVPQRVQRPRLRDGPDRPGLQEPRPAAVGDRHGWRLSGQASQDRPAGGCSCQQQAGDDVRGALHR